MKHNIHIRRFFSVFVLLSIVSISWSYDFVADGIYYNINEDGNSVSVTYKTTPSNSYSGDVVIPATVTYNSTQYSVTSIGSNAFYKCSRLTSVTIPNSVTSIGGSAFSGCSGLTSVTINSNTIVSKTYGTGSNLVSIFGSQVTEYIIGNDITSIGSYAFYNCSKLTSITIPNSVTSIDGDAFNGCNGLTKAEFASIENLCKIKFNNYYSNPLYNAKHLYIDGQEVTDVIIPNSVTSIGSYAFSGCSGLKSVTIPSSVTYISNSAFSGCSGLTSINIPESVTSIGNYAFQNCSGLTSITIPESVTSIDRDAFYGTAWYSNQPDGLVYAGKVAYKYKGTIPEGIEISVKIKEGTSGIAAFAFSGCTGLTSITIPNSVTSIGNSAFDNCYGLRSVHINDIAAWCNISFKDNNYNTNHRANPLVYAHHLFLNGQEVKDLVIPNTVISIGYDAFNGCSGLTSVTIPNSMTCIGSYAFSDCSGLTSVTIPNSVTSIDSYAFRNCSGLTFVTIPNSVTNIGSSAFSGCTALTSITIPNSVTNIGMYAFAECPLQTIVNHGNKEFGADNFSDRVYLHTQLYVPEGTVWDYIFNTGWGEFHHIKEFAANADNIRNDAVYMIADRSGRNFPVFDKATKKLKNVAYTLNIDDNDTGACWQVIEKGRDTYLYNIGAGMYAVYDEDNNLTLSIVPSNVNIDVTEDGATINGKPVMLVANKSVLPIRPTVLGDANDNSEVEIGDITSILTLMANPDAPGYNNKAADANKSGAIEIGDITTILTIMAGGE